MHTARHNAMHASLSQLNWPELPTLNAALGRARAHAFQVAVHTSSVEQVWEMIRIINDLADLAGDVDAELTRALPP